MFCYNVLSHSLQPTVSHIGALVEVVTTPFPILFPAKAAEDGPRI